VGRGTATAGAAALGEVRSAPMVRLVDEMLTESDNVVAECLARQVALARKAEVSFAGAAGAIKAVLGEVGVPASDASLVDGSGLSRQNRVTPDLLTAILTLSARPEYPQLRGVYSGLPVAGYSGTLRDRYRKSAAGAPAAGMVRAKTGTLSAVSAVAGIAIDADGRALAFAVIAEGVSSDPTGSQEALDRVAAALAACGCR
jgi:D-alanyl-D-alanine carboxypeptidase/D-alanyl-D-alanine-endopeptidase (penicillin-binding protein 4)